MRKGQGSIIQNAIHLQDGNILIELQVKFGRTKKLSGSYLVMA